MKQLLFYPFVILLFFLPNFSNAQGIIFDFTSTTNLSVINYNQFSTNVTVEKYGYPIFQGIIPPGGKRNIKFEYSGINARKLTYKAVYDDKSYKQDLRIIESQKLVRAEQIKRDAWKEIVITIIDETFFDGKFSTLFEIGKYGGMIFNGASEAEWAEALFDTYIGYEIGKNLDSSVAKGLANATYSLAKTLNSKEYKDLQEKLGYHMERSIRGYETSGFVTDTGKLPIMKLSDYPKVSLSGGYSFGQSFREHIKEGEGSSRIKAPFALTEIPIEARLAYHVDKESLLYFQFGQSGLFSNQDLASMQYLKPETAFRLRTYNLGLAVIHRFIEVGGGASYIQQENFTIANSEMMVKNPNTTDWGGFIESRINGNFGNYFQLFIGARATLFGNKQIENIRFQYTNYNAGIGIKFRRKKLNFDGN